MEHTHTNAHEIAATSSSSFEYSHRTDNINSTNQPTKESVSSFRQKQFLLERKFSNEIKLDGKKIFIPKILMFVYIIFFCFVFLGWLVGLLLQSLI